MNIQVNNKIIVFSLISVALHAAVIISIDHFSIQSPPSYTSPSYNGGDFMKVSLQSSEISPEVSPEISSDISPEKPIRPLRQSTQTKNNNHAGDNNTSDKKARTEKTEPSNITRKIIRNITIAKPAISTKSQSKAATIKYQHEQFVSSKASVIAYIQNEMHKNFSYPRLAVMRGWQGEVILSFHINKNGIIDNIHVTQSSGFALLDRAAARSLEEIKQLGNNELLNNREFSALQLPVVYLLKEG